jgi:TonB family protein
MSLSKVFLTDHEELASMVPDYWKPCVRTAGSGAAGGGGHRACRFSAEFQSIPGVAALPASAENVAEGCASQPLAGECPPAHGRGDIPRPIYEPACEFSESARKAKFQGVAMLKFVVDEQGLPKNIHITKPLGYGLNEQALKCVEKWRFKPAEKDGQPIAAEIAVEVSFHMY